MSRKTNRDHAKRQQRPMMEDEAISAQISALLTPALAKQKKYCRQLGLRDRILTLPLMVAAVLTMLWRDVAGVRELTRMLAREGFLWCDRLQVSQQALSKRFLTFPAGLFENVFSEVLPLLEEKWHQRNRRLLPESVQFTLTRLEKIWIADGSTLEALFKKLKRTPYITLRLIEVKSGKVWHSYLTSVLEPEMLPPYVVADLYGKRWRIEEAFNTVKRLLGLSYLWVGSINGVKLQIWGTWLFYAILIDERRCGS